MFSIIVPFYNEKESLPALYNGLSRELSGKSHEIIFVDDGSTDGGSVKARQITAKDTSVSIIAHKKRFGKGRALLTGYKASRGEVIIFMDADLQDDPADIKRLVKKIDEGYDLVNGWRKARNDSLSKTVPSAIFNVLLLKPFLKSKFHDINCGFKALRREVLNNIPLYGDNYRFLPILADRAGFRTTEVVVNHRPRLYGESKYNLVRLFFGLLDTFTTYFIYQFSERPLHFFGSIGGLLFLAGFTTAIILSIQRIFFGILLYRRPALLLAVLLIIVGIQIVMTGIIGELIVYLNKKKTL